MSAHQSREMALGPQECVGSSALKHWKHSIVPISLLTDQIVNLRAVETSILIIARYSDGSTIRYLIKNLAIVATVVGRPLWCLLTCVADEGCSNDHCVLQVSHCILM